jgi:3-hydroxy acid dehydrogenase/malonic semialdehyde reductase
MKTLLKNQFIVVTGASSGIGAAASRAFSCEGAHLLLGARRTERLATVASECMAAGAASASFLHLDVSNPASVATFLSWIQEKTKEIDVLINNAGGAHGLDSLMNAKDADWEAMIQSNVLGLLRMTRGILPLMLGRQGSSILNIGSIAGRIAYEGGSVYCACKAAELQITRALRLELCGTGIRVGSIDPGMVETEFSLVRFKGDKSKSEKVYQGTIPLTADDIADALVWAATRPPHVCIDEMLIKPTDQAAIHKIHRRP